MPSSLIRMGSLLLGLVALFVIIPSIAGDISPFPSLASVAGALVAEADLISQGFRWTFIRFAAAGFIGLILGVVLGVIQASSAVCRSLLTPWEDLLRVTPAVVWIPILLLIVSNFNLPIVLGSIYSSLYVTLHVEARLREISRDELAFMLGQQFSPMEKFRYSYRPRILAGAATGAKFGGSIALILVVVGEALANAVGVGSLVTSFMTSYSPPETWAVVFALGAFALLIFFALDLLEKLVGAEK